MSHKIVAVKSFAKFADLGIATLLKKRIRHRRFSMNFVNFLRKTFFNRTPPVSASGGVL